MKMGMRGAAASVLKVQSWHITGAVVAQDKSAPLTTEKDKVSYAIGLDVAKSFAPSRRTSMCRALQRATENAISGGKPLSDAEQAKATDAALRASVSARRASRCRAWRRHAAPPVDRVNVGADDGRPRDRPVAGTAEDDIESPGVPGRAHRHSQGQPKMTQADAGHHPGVRQPRRPAEVTSNQPRGRPRSSPRTRPSRAS
jgi:FKBP-type peptidyl-prolyl cis-trans isomerase FkpA